MVAINFPDSPTNGQEHEGYVWDATNNVWNRLPTLPALDLINFSAVAPSNPQDGQFWFDTTVGKMYVYYNDGSSSQWVSAIGGLASQQGTEGQLLVHDGSEWIPTDGVSHNAIINGDFGIWQRGTSFTSISEYSADRWKRTGSGTATISQQSFTPSDVEAIGYGDAKHYLRLDVTTSASFTGVAQPIEDVRTFAGQEVTFSFWAKGTNPGGSSNFQINLRQFFGSGGSSASPHTEDFVVTSSWVRYSFTKTLGSMAGKTIGSDSNLQATIQQFGSDTDAWTLDIWGVQLEAGPVATPFRLAGGGSKAAELALCERYYQVIASGPVAISQAAAYNTTAAYGIVRFKTSMRTSPSLIQATGTDYYQFYRSGSADSFDSFASTSGASPSGIRINATSGLSHTAGVGGWFEANNASSYIAFDAEL